MKEEALLSRFEGNEVFIGTKIYSLFKCYFIELCILFQKHEKQLQKMFHAALLPLIFCLPVLPPFLCVHLSH